MNEWIKILLNLVGVCTMIQLYVNNRTLKMQITYLLSEQQYISKSLMSLTEKYEARIPDSSKTIKDGLKHGDNIPAQKKRTKQKRYWER